MPDRLSSAVDYHYGKFPPENLRYEALIDPVSEAAAAISRYDQMLASMHNSEIRLAPLRNQEAVVSSRMEGAISTLDEVLRIEAEDEASQTEAFQHARSEAVETFLYTRAMRRIQREIEAGRPLSEFLIRQAHQILLSFGRGGHEITRDLQDRAELYRRKTPAIGIFCPDQSAGPSHRNGISAEFHRKRPKESPAQSGDRAC